MTLNLKLSAILLRLEKYMPTLNVHKVLGVIIILFTNQRSHTPTKTHFDWLKLKVTFILLQPNIVMWIRVLR